MSIQVMDEYTEINKKNCANSSNTQSSSVRIHLQCLHNWKGNSSSSFIEDSRTFLGLQHHQGAPGRVRMGSYSVYGDMFMTCMGDLNDMKKSVTIIHLTLHSGIQYPAQCTVINKNWNHV